MKYPNIIWIVMDCLRADHLGCYGYELNTSPFIDSLVEEALKFNFAFSATSYTVPSIASMFTSKYPSSHSVKFNQKSPKISKDNEILIAEILKSVGYQTAAFVGALVLRKEIGLNVGFDIYDDRMDAAEANRPSELIRNGEKTNENVLKWFKNEISKPFFLFIHYFDVHGSYTNPAPYDSVFDIDAYSKVPILLNKVSEGVEGGIPDYQLLSVIKSKKGEMVEYEHDARYYLAQYDGGIRYLDNILNKLFNDLKKMGVYDDTLIFLTADHGEAMGENNVWFFHSLTVTPDQIHVPLIIKLPLKWKIPSRSIDTHVSLIDLMPTILDLIDFKYDELDLQGKSLKSIIFNEKDNELANRTIMAEIEGQKAYIDQQNLRIKPKYVDRKKLTFFYAPELCNKEVTIDYRLKSIKKLEWTGERYLPELESPEISYEHWHRYLFAQNFVKNKIVLDIACGEGYGSYLLAGDAKKVIGVDSDENTINYAVNKYNRDNLKFKKGLVEDVPIKGSEVFDVIVSFETLEHIEEEKQKKFLDEVKRLVNKKGLFLVSTPEKFAYSDERNFKNEFHKKEFYLDEFKEFLGNYFKHIVLFGQRIYPISYIWNITNASKRFYEYNIICDSAGFRPTTTDEKLPLYILAACSNERILIHESSLSIDITARLIKDRDNRISEQKNMINMYEKKINSIYSSRTWKLGRFATAPFRFIKRTLLQKD